MKQIDYKAALQTEVDACYLYKKIAEAEDQKDVAEIFTGMSEIENEHAGHMFEKLKSDGLILSMPGPSGRAKILNFLGKILGYDYLIGIMVDMEKSIAVAQTKAKNEQHIPLEGNEGNHVMILQNLLNRQSKVTGEKIQKIEGRHKSIGGNALRAAVLGANDGLVSNMSLVMGVAGATNGESGVLLAGLAGLLAGALSMALGEWISVTSSKELYERQMELEMVEIETNPEGETKEITLLYMAKGIPEEKAHEMAVKAMMNKNDAHEILVKEELGINPEDLNNSAWEAAIASFLMFAVGAIIPVIPFLFIDGLESIILCVCFSAIGLFGIGAAITLFTGKNFIYSGLRQVLFGLLASAITFGIGKLVGVSIA